MLIGYNTNVKYRGKTYHVQTEDSGPTNPQIVTLLYHQGAILASKKTNYAHLLGQPDLEEKLRNLMKQQHREMMMELKRIAGGERDEDLESVNKESVTEGQERSNTLDPEAYGNGGEKEQDSSGEKDQKKGLDDILIDFITRRGRK